jgi:hypothetical protein
MSGPGIVHTFADGYSFIETIHGPLTEGVCVDCGTRTYVVQRTGRFNEWGLEEDTGGTAESRCSTCGRKHYELPPF